MKTIGKLLVTALFITALTITLASCFGIGGIDIDDAEDALEYADYSVYVEKDYELEYGIMAEKYLRAYDDNDNILIIQFEKSKTAKLFYKMSQAQIQSEATELESEIKLYEHFLKEYEDTLKSDDIDDLEDEIKSLKEELEDLKEERVCDYSGNIVWIGTADAIEDAKG